MAFSERIKTVIPFCGFRKPRYSLPVSSPVYRHLERAVKLPCLSAVRTLSRVLRRQSQQGGIRPNRRGFEPICGGERRLLRESLPNKKLLSAIRKIVCNHVIGADWLPVVKIHSQFDIPVDPCQHLAQVDSRCRFVTSAGNHNLDDPMRRRWIRSHDVFDDTPLLDRRGKGRRCWYWLAGLTPRRTAAASKNDKDAKQEYSANDRANDEKFFALSLVFVRCEISDSWNVHGRDELVAAIGTRNQLPGKFRRVSEGSLAMGTKHGSALSAASITDRRQENQQCDQKRPHRINQD